MNLASRSCCLLAMSGLLALGGCGGSTYNLGNTPPDGGKDGGTGQAACFSFNGDGGCEGGNTSGFDFGDAASVDCVSSSGDCDGSSGFAFDDGGKNNTGTTDAGVSTTSGCTAAAIACTGGATGYACPPGGVDPAMGQTTLSCTSGIIEGYNVDFCCFPWTAGTDQCTPEEGADCDDNSYGYQCTPGTAPSDVDTQLKCGEPFPDSNGSNDYCCTHP
jgi:hypothetical protein